MIKFTTKRTTKSKILSISKGEFADIVDMNDSYIQLRLVFNINLMTQDNNPTSYKKVVVSLKREGYGIDAETVIDTSNPGVKVNNNPTDFSLIRPLPKRHPSISKNNYADVRSPTVAIPALAMKRIAKNFSMIKNFNKSKNTQDKITSCTVYIDDYISDALKRPYETTVLVTPEKVSLNQGLRRHQDRIERNSLLVDVNKEFLSPVSLLQSDNQSDFAKKFHDYFIHDAPHPSKEFIDTLSFFSPIKSLRYLDELEIPCTIKLPIKYRDANITVNFELYEHGAIRATELDFAQLDIKKLMEAYDVIDGNVIVDSSTKNADSSFTKNYLASFSYDDMDTKKIKLFNVYTKPFLNYGIRESNYRLAGALTPQKISEVTSLSLLEKNVESLQMVRVVPVTATGESSNFTDTVIGESISTNLTNNFVLVARQQDANTIQIDTFNVNTKLDFLKIYRRKCRNSSDSEFRLAAIYKRIKASNFSWFDSEVTPGEIYEYYAVVEDADGVKQISNYSIIEFKKISKNNSQSVRVSEISANSEKISFMITTTQQKNSDNSSTLYDSAVSAAYVSSVSNSMATATGAGTVPNAAGIPSLLKATQEKTFEPPKPENYKNIYFHLVSRIDMLSGEKESFNLVSDGLFIDDIATRRQDFVTRISPGRKYMYEIQTFVRDPLTIKRDFIVTGEKNNAVWFNRPYKWKNPNVISTGILRADDDDGIPEISNFDNHTADFIGTTMTKEIALPKVPKYNPISPTAEKISRSIVKVSWELPKNSFYDSFVVVKVVNGIRSIIGKTKTDTFYHRITEDDLGCVYYEITSLLSDLSIDRTYHTDSITIEEDLSYKGPRIIT